MLGNLLSLHFDTVSHSTAPWKAKPDHNFGSVSQVHTSFIVLSSDLPFLAVWVVLGIYLQYSYASPSCVCYFHLLTPHVVKYLSSVHGKEWEQLL